MYIYFILFYFIFFIFVPLNFSMMNVKLSQLVLFDKLLGVLIIRPEYFTIY